jgi:uncharacterized membrane protein YphA (DoxX/SURF4 family)
MKTKEKPWLIVLRILLAAVFLFSGFTKAIDPSAFAIKIDEYFISFGMGFFHPVSMFIAVMMIILEFTLGFMLLFKIYVKFTSIVYLLFMLFFFFLTLWLAVAEYLEVNYGFDFGVVKDCGCFGKAIKLSNLETFLKNVIIMIPTLIIFFKRKSIPEIRLTTLGRFTMIAIGVLIVGVIEFYCYRHLPIIDYSDWKKGTDVVEAFIDRPAQKDLIFIYQNNTDSSRILLTENKLSSITDSIPDFFEKYQYVDRKDSITVAPVPSKISGFNMVDSIGADHSFELINNDDDQILLLMFMSDLDEVKLDVFKNNKFKALFDSCRNNGIAFVGITNSSSERINSFKTMNELTFPIYYNQIDPIKGPFMVRDALHSNPGLILLKKGVVVDKWSWRDFPSFEDIK